MDIGHIIGPEGFKLGERLRQRLQRLMGQNFLNSGTRSTSTNMPFKISRGDNGAGRSRAQHAGDPLNIGILAADIHGVGHGTGNQSRILAAKKHRHEFRSGFGNHRNPVAALHAGRHQFPRRGQSPAAQFRVGQNMAQHALGRIEIKSGQPARRIIQTFGNCLKSSELLLQITI